MQKIWLILIFVVFLPFSCSDVSTEEDPDSGRGGFGDDSEEDEESGRRGRSGSSLGDKNACEGDDYTLYLNDCPEEGGDPTGTNTSTLSGEGRLEGEIIGKPIDILFVLDTSASMSYWYHASHFKKKLKHFIPRLRRVSWRIFFTTASLRKSVGTYSQGITGQAMPIESKSGLLSQRTLDSSSVQRDRSFLNGDRGSLNPEKLFFYTMTKEPNREHEGSGRDSTDNFYANKYPPYMGGGEYPLRALQSSFAVNKSLMREEADLVAIIVSNTDENPQKKSPDPTAKSIMQEFQKVYGESKSLFLLNLIILPGDKKCLAEQNSRQFLFKESHEGQKIAKVAEEIGGGNFSICMGDYSPLADTIGRLSTR